MAMVHVWVSVIPLLVLQCPFLIVGLLRCKEINSYSFYSTTMQTAGNSREMHEKLNFKHKCRNSRV
jgi:hypothetical protein